MHKNADYENDTVTISDTVLAIDNIVPSPYMAVSCSSFLFCFRRIYVPKTIDLMRKRTYSLCSPEGAVSPSFVIKLRYVCHFISFHENPKTNSLYEFYVSLALLISLDHINLPPLLINSLFKDMFNSSGYIELNDRTIEYWIGKMWTKVVLT